MEIIHLHFFLIYKTIVGFLCAVVFVIWIIVTVTSISSFPGVCALTRHGRSFALPMNKAVSVHEKRLPIFSSAIWHSASNSFVEIGEDHFLILLQQFVGELGQQLKERKVGRRGSWIVWILQRIYSSQNAFMVKLSHCFAVLESIKSERERKPFSEFLDCVEFLRASVRPTAIILQFLELVDQRLNHGLGAVDFVIIPGFAQGSLDDVSVIIVKCDVVFENVSSGFGGKNVIDDKFAVASQKVSPFVQLLNLLMVVNFLVFLVHKNMLLYKLI